MRRHLPLVVLVLPLAVALVGACGNDRLRRSGEQVEVVAGTPTVGTGLPSVDRSDGGADASFGSAAPFQVDSFSQQAVQKVDILWVIDNSKSMQSKQDRVKANFDSFMVFLTDQHIDYHLGVVTSDVFSPAGSGRLVNKAGLPKPWIDLTTAAPQVAFRLNADVGTLGSGDEKPLLAGMLGLTAPLSPASPTRPDAGAANCANLSDGGVECFLRPEAPLYTILVSDEEDSSCSPVNAILEGCDNAAATLNGYGSIEYWTRFYSGIKGLGGTSRVASIVANETTPHECKDVFGSYCTKYGADTKCVGSHPDCRTNNTETCCAALNACKLDVQEKAQWCQVSFVTGTTQTSYTVNGSWQGCVARTTDGGVDFTAYSSERMTKVAEGTGGIATSICDADYTPALARLGLQAAGLRSDFPLSRAPIPSSVEVRVDGAILPGSASTWQYVDCENPPPATPLPHPPTNAVRFKNPPVPGSKLSVSYAVNVRGLRVCP